MHPKERAAGTSEVSRVDFRLRFVLCPSVVVHYRPYHDLHCGTPRASPPHASLRPQPTLVTKAAGVFTVASHTPERWMVRCFTSASPDSMLIPDTRWVAWGRLVSGQRYRPRTDANPVAGDTGATPGPSCRQCPSYGTSLSLEEFHVSLQRRLAS